MTEGGEAILARGAAWAFAAAFAAFLWTSAPGLGWLDSGELATGAFSLGVAHPPGEPAWILLGRLAQALPVGDLAGRLVLLSAAAGAAATALAFALAAAGPGLPHVRLVAGGAAAALAGAGALWLQSVRIELYTLQAALLLGAAAAARSHGRTGDPRHAAAGGLLFGLALANHHALAVAAAPGLLIAAGRRGGARSLAPALLLAILGASAFLLLPVRAAAGPLLLWDDASRWEGFLRVLTAAEYRRSFAPTDGAAIARNALLHAEALGAAVGLTGIGLAGIGALAWARREPAWAWGFGALVAGTLAPTALQGVYDPTNPDAAGYQATAFALVAVAAGEGVARALEAGRPGAAGRARAAAGLLLLAAALVSVVPEAARHADRRGWYGARHLGRAVLDSVPPMGALVGSGDAWLLPAMYLAAVERWRDDVHLPRLAPPPGRPEPVAVRYVPGPWPFLAREAGLVAERHRDPPGVRTAGAPDPERLLRRWAAPLRADPSFPREIPAHQMLAAIARGRAAILLSRGQARRAAEVLTAAAAADPKPDRMIHLEAYAVRRYVEALGAAARAGGAQALLSRTRAGDDAAWAALAAAAASDPEADRARVEAALAAGWLDAAPPSGGDPTSRRLAKALEGRRLLEAGQARPAAALLAEVHRQAPADPAAADWAARAMLAAGDVQGARDLWVWLLRERPGWPGALLGLDRLRAYGIVEEP